MLLRSSRGSKKQTEEPLQTLSIQGCSWIRTLLLVPQGGRNRWRLRLCPVHITAKTCPRKQRNRVSSVVWCISRDMFVSVIESLTNDRLPPDMILSFGFCHLSCQTDIFRPLFVNSSQKTCGAGLLTPQHIGGQRTVQGCTRSVYCVSWISFIRKLQKHVSQKVT